MAVSDNHKSQDWYSGFTTAMVFLSEIFESHSNGLTQKYHMRQKDLRLGVNIIDACIRRREVLAEVGPKNMNLFVSKKGSVSLKEK